MAPYVSALKTGLEAQNQPSNNNLTRVPPEQAPVSTPNPPKWATSDYSNMDWGMNWDKPSSYKPTNEYVRPWDVEGWGTDDVVVTPPRSPGNYVPPSRPALQEGQRDYVFMPTEKEQWRIGDENKRRQALAVGKDWREARLPRSVPEEPKEKVYPDWDKPEIPERREVTIQPVFGDKPWDSKIPERRGEPYQDDSMWKKYPRREREWDDSEVGPGKKYPFGKPDPRHGPDVIYSKDPREEDRRVYAGGGSPIRGISGHDYVNNPKYKDHREHREKQPRRPSLRDTLVGDMRRSWR